MSIYLLDTTLGITIEAAEQDVPGVNCWTPMEIDLDCTDCYSYPNHDPIAWNEMIGDVLKWMRENMVWVELASERPLFRAFMTAKQTGHVGFTTL